MLIPSDLKQRACETTGLSEYGAASLDDGLQTLCRSLSEQGDLNAPAAEGMEGSIVAMLCERLRVEDWFARHPEILEQTLAPQVLVVGLPRSGTTALSQFISADPAARSIRRWELNSLTPPPDASASEPDPRIAATQAAFAARDRAMPKLKSMLPVTAEDASEHGVLLGLTFRNMHWPSLNTIPDYASWVLQCDMDLAFSYLVSILKLLQWKNPVGYWNLKNPVDSFAIDALLRVFPDAPVFWMHRDPANTIPSVCSLLSLIRDSSGLEFDRKAFGRYVLEFEAGLIDTAMARRDASPHRDRVIDVYNRDLAADPVATMRAIYGKAGKEFTPAFEAALRQRIADRPRGSHGKHDYSAEEFGLESVSIRRRFANYIERFDVPLEG